jgi:hypothetical protein
MLEAVSPPQILEVKIPEKTERAARIEQFYKEADLIKPETEIPAWVWNLAGMLSVKPLNGYKYHTPSQDPHGLEGFSASHSGDEARMALWIKEFKDQVVHFLELDKGPITIGEYSITADTLEEDMAILTLLSDLGKAGSSAFGMQEVATLYNHVIMEMGPNSVHLQKAKELYHSEKLTDLTIAQALEVVKSVALEQSQDEHQKAEIEQTYTFKPDNWEALASVGYGPDSKIMTFFTKAHLDLAKKLFHENLSDSRLKALGLIALGHHFSQGETTDELQTLLQTSPQSEQLMKLIAFQEVLDKVDASLHRNPSPYATVQDFVNSGFTLQKKLIESRIGDSPIYSGAFELFESSDVTDASPLAKLKNIL